MTEMRGYRPSSYLFSRCTGLGSMHNNERAEHWLQVAWQLNKLVISTFYRHVYSHAPPMAS